MTVATCPLKLRTFDYEAMLEMFELIKERRDRKDASEENPDKPPHLKDFGSWRIFWEKLDSYFSQTYGVAEIPLNYIYRTHTEVTDEMRVRDYESNDQLYYMITALRGSHYQEDNKRVFAELKDATIDGPGWTFIKQFARTRDGRKAVLTLKAQAEGQAAVQTRKAKAYAKIESARYTGPKRNWTFDNYIERHVSAHAELAELGEPVPEGKKVTDFLKGISAANLENGKDIVLSTLTYRENFEQCQQYLNGLVASKAQQAKIERAVAKIETDKGPKGGKGGKQGKEGKRGRGGHGLTIEGRHYSKADWDKLSAEEQKKVRMLRAAKKSKAGKQLTDAEKRLISELHTKHVSFADEQGNGQEEEEDDGQEDAQFGRDAHKKKKAKSGDRE